MNYEIEVLDSDHDDGTMPDNLAEFTDKIVGHRIVSVESVEGFDRKIIEKYDMYYWGDGNGLKLTLDNGKSVLLFNTDDCCAFTEVDNYILNLDKIEHVITGVGTTDGYQVWHIYADLGDIVTIDVGWSSGNPFYYGYGFKIVVIDEEEYNELS